MAGRRKEAATGGAKKEVCVPAGSTGLPATASGMKLSPGQRAHAAAKANPDAPNIDVAGIIGKAIMDQLPEGLVEDAMETIEDVKAFGADLVDTYGKALASPDTPTYEEMGPRKPWKNWQDFDRNMAESFAPMTAAPEAVGGAVPADKGYISEMRQNNLSRLLGMSDGALDLLEERLSGSMGSTPSGKAMLTALTAERQRRLQ